MSTELPLSDSSHHPLAAIHGPGEVAEVRMIHRPTRTVVSTHCTDFVLAMKFAAEYNELGYDCYHMLNKLKPASFFGLNTPPAKGPTAGAKHVERYEWILIDGDPNRAAADGTPLGGAVCSTEAEYEAALTVVNNIASSLFSRYGVRSLIQGSGNGGYCLIPTDLAPEDRSLVRCLLETIAEEYDTPYVHIDQSVHDPSRVGRLAGTLNMKDEAEGRPRRKSVILSPGSRDKLLTKDEILQIISARRPKFVDVDDAVNSETEEKREAREPRSGIWAYRFGEEIAAEEWVDGWLEKYEVPHSKRIAHNGAWKWPLIVKRDDLGFCPNSDKHSTDSAGNETGAATTSLLWTSKKGEICFRCWHGHCTHIQWKQFRSMVEAAATAVTTNERGL